MKKLFVFLFLITYCSLFAESNHEKVIKALKNGKYNSAKEILTEWEKN